MRPFVVHAGLRWSIDSFAVRWPSLVTSVETLVESDQPYLGAIARYSNSGGIPDGTFGIVLDLAPDAEFDRLLDFVGQFRHLSSALVALLLARTSAALALGDFADDANALHARVEAAKFEYLSPFCLEGTMADDLFFYGMYEFFYQHHSAIQARALAASFLSATVGDDPENIVAMTTRLPWGNWFDPHSCTDRSWVIVGRNVRRAWVLGFSHSD